MRSSKNPDNERSRSSNFDHRNSNHPAGRTRRNTDKLNHHYPDTNRLMSVFDSFVRKDNQFNHQTKHIFDPTANNCYHHNSPGSRQRRIEFHPFWINLRRQPAEQRWRLWSSLGSWTRWRLGWRSAAMGYITLARRCPTVGDPSRWCSANLGVVHPNYDFIGVTASEERPRRRQGSMDIDIHSDDVYRDFIDDSHASPSNGYKIW